MMNGPVQIFDADECRPDIFLLLDFFRKVWLKRSENMAACTRFGKISFALAVRIPVSIHRMNLRRIADFFPPQATEDRGAAPEKEAPGAPDAPEEPGPARNGAAAGGGGPADRQTGQTGRSTVRRQMK